MATSMVSLEENGDAYDALDDLESWYAASLPPLHSSASFAHLTDAFRQRPNATIRTTTARPESEDDDDALVYAINLDAKSENDAIDTQNETEKSSTAPPHETTQRLDQDDAVLDFVPKPLRKPIGSVIAAARCCDRCKSDLNRKLLVACAGCAFRRHRYCFTPPLRQHPALSAVAHVPRHTRRAIATLVAQWRCETCVARRGGGSPIDVTTRTLQPTTSSPDKPTHTTTTRPPPNASPTKPPQPRTSRSRAPPFDWHAFRADKLANVLAIESNRDEEPHRDGRMRSLHHALVFYSPTDALLRKTARFWQQHVAKRRQQRARQAARLAKCEPPARRPLQVAISPREALEIAASNQRRQQAEEALQHALFDDASFYPTNDPRPVFATLRWRPLPTIRVGEHDDDAPKEPQRLAREALERQRMDAEDDDAPTPAQAERIARRRAVAAAITNDPSLLGLYLAARIIERVCVQWRSSVRQRLRNARHAAVAAAVALREREQHELALMSAEETRQRATRDHTQRRLQRLRYVVKFLLVMTKAQRRVQVQKQLVALLVDARDDTAAATSDDHPQSDHARVETPQQLARRRIQRFFYRRVRRYMQLQKRVMARRLVRWWKRRHAVWTFRQLAIEARHVHRDHAARRIQRAFRSYRVYKTFQCVREKHLLRRVARCLRGWRMRRLARKERDRVALLDAAVAITGRYTVVAWDARVHEILEALGLALYERSDFWNAAAVLAHVAKLHPERMDRATQFALAYSHHQSWYASCDPFQLAQAEAWYRALVTDRQASAEAFVLQELALVLMHRESFRASLQVLARLIELFRENDSFPLWLLLAGVQLAQLGRYDESVSYLGYLVDMALPAPYEERDVLALCAMSYEKTHVNGASVAAKEAWRAAVRLWTVAKKVTTGGVTTQPTRPGPTGTSTKHDARSRVSAIRKWGLLVDLAQRARNCGHYLIACRALLYALDRLGPVIDGPVLMDGRPLIDGHQSIERQRAWWMLGDTFRHLGHWDLFVEATARNRTTTSEEEQTQWRADAETTARRFQRDLTTLSPVALVSQIRKQYEQSVVPIESDLQLEDMAIDG